jgi:hypothetical protein
MMCSQPISSPVSSKMQAAPASISRSKAMPAAGAVRAAADRADDEIGGGDRHGGHRIERPALLLHPGAALGDAGAGAAGALDHHQLDRAAARLDGAQQPVAIEALAAEADQ